MARKNKAARKWYRYRPDPVAMREIRRYQKSNELLISKLAKIPKKADAKK